MTTAGIRSCISLDKVDMVAIKGSMSVAMVEAAPKKFSEASGGAVSLDTFWRVPIRVCPISCTAGRETGRLDTSSVDSLDGCINIEDLLGEELYEASDDSNSLMFSRHAQTPLAEP